LTDILGKPLSNYHYKQHPFLKGDEYFITDSLDGREITIIIDKRKRIIIWAEMQLNINFPFNGTINIYDYKEAFITARSAMNKYTGTRPLSRHKIDSLYYVTRNFIIHLQNEWDEQKLNELNEHKLNEHKGWNLGPYYIYITAMLPRR
jgi:hypothetical protein